MGSPVQAAHSLLARLHEFWARNTACLAGASYPAIVTRPISRSASIAQHWGLLLAPGVVCEFNTWAEHAGGTAWAAAASCMSAAGAGVAASVAAGGATGACIVQTSRVVGGMGMADNTAVQAARTGACMGLGLGVAAGSVGASAMHSSPPDMDDALRVGSHGAGSIQQLLERELGKSDRLRALHNRMFSMAIEVRTVLADAASQNLLGQLIACVVLVLAQSGQIQQDGCEEVLTGKQNGRPQDQGAGATSHVPYCYLAALDMPPPAPTPASCRPTRTGPPAAGAGNITPWGPRPACSCHSVQCQHYGGPPPAYLA